jgi:6-phosphofructokinase
MINTQGVAQFLASEMESRPENIQNEVEKIVFGHLQRFGVSSEFDSYFQERRRLAAAFGEKARDSELRDLILSKILALNPV